MERAPAPTRTWKERLQALGKVGLVLHLSIFVTCIAVLAVTLEAGVIGNIPWLAERVPTGATSWFAAYVLTKLLSVPRIALTLVLTPPVDRALRRASGAR